ncbi:hypothetical protein ISP15_03170 [Dyella jejuensis]|uniref:Uncharacterized protein n=1 Tax=Dyella jejuensis TaxID=1432009 RepID=A0ABW8JGB7_9GAMM
MIVMLVCKALCMAVFALHRSMASACTPIASASVARTKDRELFYLICIISYAFYDAITFHTLYRASAGCAAYATSMEVVVCYHWIDISRNETVDALLEDIESSSLLHQRLTGKVHYVKGSTTGVNVGIITADERKAAPADLLAGFMHRCMSFHPHLHGGLRQSLHIRARIVSRYR